MKTMKKFASLLVVLALVMSLATTAFADDGYTLTLKGAQAGHTYTAYQIFAGDLSGDTLSNIVWGAGVNTEAEGFNLGDAAAKAESLKSVTDAEAFAAAVAPYLVESAGKSATVATGATSCTISGLAAGYYLVQTTATSDKNDVYTYYIMKIVKDTTADIKADVPEVDKTVDDSDANIGDTVTFTLTATMPTNIQGYEKYTVIFHDTMSAGLTFGKITEVKVKDADVDASKYVLNPTAPVAGEKFTITFADVLALGAGAGDTIVVKYTATLNEDAVIGTEGNPNKVYLEYSNNPNVDGDGETGNTPEDEVKVYTWQIPVFKYINGENGPEGLAGAGFTLYKDKACNEAVKLVPTEDATVYQVCAKPDCDHNGAEVDGDGHVTEIITDANGRFQIEGLDSGTYYLKETKTPAGYNTAPVKTVVIDKDGLLNPTGEGEEKKGEAEVAILNQAGTVIPETGGMGTTIFYVCGGIMVLAAVVLLVTKRRMHTAK